MKKQITEDKKIQEQQNNFNNALITATEGAVRRLKSVMKADGKDNHILRMSVEGGGCSGMTYKMDFEDKKL
jgi:iron-sulfur cluster assembly protein